MSKKQKQRSVAIQSTDFFNTDIEAGRIRVTLKKKQGFRNLLQQSVTITSQKNETENPHFLSALGRRSKSVQAEMETDFINHIHNDVNRNWKSFSKIKLSEQDGGSSKTTPGVTEQNNETSNPGPSRLMSEGFSSLSVVSQINSFHITRHEGSLAVTYGYGERKATSSVTSTILYGSQGSRRFSDETVLLIEDYQSYDQANATRRQDLHSDRRIIVGCYPRNSRRSTRASSGDVLAKPLRISFEKLDEVFCRICHEGEETESLIQPCLCKGSVGYLHASCLKVWLEQSSTSRCELCNYPYAIRQNRKYTKCVSIRVFYKAIFDRRALLYDIISFVVITPLTLVAVAMCIQASVASSTSSSISSESYHQIGYITKIGMAMLCGTIVVAYAVWLYTLISFHYKSWKRWYENCYNVEVIPVRMTSQERIEASRRLNEEINRRHFSREHGSMVVTPAE